MEDVHDYPIDDLHLAINFGVKGRGHSELGIQ